LGQGGVGTAKAVAHRSRCFSGEGIAVSPTSAQIQRNWLRLSQLVTLVAIGLRKPYDKSESGTNLVMYEVYWLAMMMLFNRMEIPGIHF
jgi:hypothetical protein